MVPSYTATAGPFCAAVDIYERLKQHQIAWASNNGIPDDEREVSSRRAWVLKKEAKERNLYDPQWWRYIAGFEHRWARSLTSSQCFAVNLFAPLASDTVLAKAVFTRVVPHRSLEPLDEVRVELEHTPDGARDWLGERRQPTQVDVFFTVSRAGAPLGHGRARARL